MRTILHSDLNNFYASVECLYHPELAQKPMAVTGDPELRHGIILSKNEIAKAYGVKTAEPLWMAKQKCPDIVFVPAHHAVYQEYSNYAREIYLHYTDQVENFGLDECWLDVTGSFRLFGSGEKIANEIRSRMRKKLGITVSVGVSFTKTFAKLGSDMKKPDGTTVISYENMKNIVWPLPVSSLLYIGQATTRKLNRYGIYTIGELASSRPDFIRYILGKNGISLWQCANGLDISPVQNIAASQELKSVGNSITTPHDLATEEQVKVSLFTLSDNVAARLRKHNLTCSSVQIWLRENTLFSYERQKALSFTTSNSKDIFSAAYELYCYNKPKHPLRSVGVRAIQLIDAAPLQLSFLPQEQDREKEDKLERSVDRIRERFGFSSIQRGIALMEKNICFTPHEASFPKQNTTI